VSTVGSTLSIGARMRPCGRAAISARIEVSAHDLDGAPPRLGRADDLRSAERSPTRSEHTNRNVCSGADFGPSRGDPCRRAFRPIEASRPANRDVSLTSIPAGRSATSHVECLAAETSGLTRPLILERGSIVFRRASGNGDRLRTIVFHKGLCLGGGAGWHVRVNVAKAGLHNYLADQRCRLSFKNCRGRRSTRLPVRA
jgi:hypothetical protein